MRAFRKEMDDSVDAMLAYGCLAMGPSTLLLVCGISVVIVWLGL